MSMSSENVHEAVREVVQKLRRVEGIPAQELAALEISLSSLSGKAVGLSVWAARQRLLVDVLGKTLAEPNLANLLSNVLDGMVELSGARRGFLVLGERADKAEVVIRRNIREEELGSPEFAPSRTVLGRAFGERKTVRIRDALADPELAAAASVVRQGVLSILCVPLMSGGRILGAIYLDHNRVSGIFDEPTEEVLTHFAQVITGSVFQAKVVKELLEANRRLVQNFHDHFNFEGIVGSNAVLREAIQTVSSVADSRVPVLIQGETGTGKELIAKALHNASARRDGPFVAVNCAALPEGLLESELFGHERGAFTGAHEARPGRIEAARGGTLLLDEIAELTPALQARFLRFIQTGEVQRVGADRPHQVDVRVVAATHRDLSRMVAEGTFREDLYYRLNVVTVRLPALRERREDMSLLIDHFLRKAADAQDKSLPALDPEANFILLHHGYPGNVRELENVVTRALLLCTDNVIRREDLPPHVLGGRAEVMPGVPVPANNEELKKSRNHVRRESVRRLERAFVERALTLAVGDVAAAAESTGTNRTFFYELMKRHGVRPEQFLKA